MRLEFGGVRGTRPATGAAYTRYGGDTTSLLVTGAAGERLLIDGGSGLRHFTGLGDAGQPLVMLLTHYHLDHLAGLPTFSPLYQRGRTLTFAAPPNDGQTAAAVLRGLIRAPYWPVALDESAATIRFVDLPAVPPDSGWRCGGLAVRWSAVHHRNGCHAYRVEEAASGRSFVFATDIEWPLSTPAERTDLLALCRTPTPADLLVMDGQYDADTYERHRGWGHSRWQDCLDVARLAGIRQVMATHHSPTATDDDLDNLQQRGRSLLPSACLARQGMRVTPGEDPV